MVTLSADVYAAGVRQGPLADRGSFDQYGVYAPGQVVLNGGVLYLCIAPIGATVELEDTFNRRDQVGWGQSSHGEVWETSAGWADSGPPSVSGGRGVLLQTAGGNRDGQLLGPSRLRGDAEVLVLASLSVAATGEHDAIQVALNATEDGATEALTQVFVADDGTTAVALAATVAPHGTEAAETVAGPTVVDGQACWVRLRRIGLDYSATLWPSGAPEPATPQATLTATYAQPAGHPLLYAVMAAVGHQVAVAYLSVRPLTATPAPADDAAHWVALADALTPPTPL